MILISTAHAGAVRPQVERIESNDDAREWQAQLNALQRQGYKTQEHVYGCIFQGVNDHGVVTMIRKDKES